MSLLRSDLQATFTDFFATELNNNTLGIVFKPSYLHQIADQQFEYRIFPQYYTTQTIKYIPVAIEYQTTAKNLEELDSYDFTAQLQFLLTGDNDNDPNLIKQTQAIEELRKELVYNPNRIIPVNDTAYQLYNDTNNTGKVPLAWEANTEYTILYNIPSFTDDLSYTVVSGIEIDALSVTIAIGTTGTGAVKFTTGATPTTDHKQFVTSGGLIGNVKIRTALLKGDFEFLDSETILNIIDNKDRSGTYTNLIDNSDDFKNWTTKDYVLEYTTLNYNTLFSATFISRDVSSTNHNGNIQIPMTMSVSMESNLGLSFGNAVKYKLNEDGLAAEEVVFLTSSNALGKNVDTGFLFGDTRSKTKAIDGTYQYEAVLMYENKTVINALVKDVLNGTPINKKYDLTIIFPNITETVKPIIITGATLNVDLNQVISLSIQILERA